MLKSYNNSQAEFQNQIDLLKKSNFIDSSTRAIFLSLTLLHPDKDFWHFIQLVKININN